MTKQIFKENWERYRELGFIPYPASRKGKNPIPNWGNDLPPPISDDYAEWEEEYPNANIWLYLGKDFAVIDPDGPGAEDFVKSLGLPSGPTSVSGNKSIHRWFKSPSNIKPIKAMNGQDQTFLEVRTGTMGILAPPSIHPETGKPYHWLKGHSPWELPFPILPMEAYEKIKALLPKREPKMEVPEDVSGRFNVAKYLTRYAIKFRIKPDGTRTIYQLERCPFADGHTTKDIQGDSSIIQGNDGKLGFHCFHNHCAFKTWKDAREIISGDDKLSQFISETHIKNHSQSANIITAAELKSLDFPEQVPIITRGIMPAQSGIIIAGPSEIGKSLLIFEMSIRLSLGMNFLDFTVPQARRVLIIQKENSMAAMKFRLSKISQGLSLIDSLDNLLFTDVKERFNLKNPGDIRRLTDRVGENRVEVCFLDPLSSFHTRDENDNMHMREILDHLTDISRATNCAFTTIHHYGKQDEYRGASSIKDWADTFIGYERQGPIRKNIRRLRFLKIRNGPPIYRPILLQRDFSTFIHTLTADETICPSAKVKEILDELGGMADSKKILIDEVSKQQECAEPTARRAIKKAIEEKMIYEFKEGRRKKISIDFVE